jgi:hypothetical protein
MSRRTDIEHEHIHLVVNRIQFDEKVTSDSHDYRRQECLMRALECDLGLGRLKALRKPNSAPRQQARLKKGFAPESLDPPATPAASQCGGK